VSTFARVEQVSGIDIEEIFERESGKLGNWEDGGRIRGRKAIKGMAKMRGIDMREE